MGLADYTVGARVEATAAESTSWHSTTSVRVGVSSGAWDLLPIAATIGLLHGTQAR